MIGLLLRFIELPCMILGCGAAIAAICGAASCLRCKNFRARDIGCVKWFLRRSGQDSFDDFDLYIHVHEMVNLQMRQKTKLKIRITAGRETVMTDKSSKGIFQCPLTLHVQQGTENVVVDLIDDRDALLAQLKLSVERDILPQKKAQDKVYFMKERNKACPLNPQVRLMLGHTSNKDVEDPLKQSWMAGKDAQMVMLMQQKLHMAEQEVKSHDRRGHRGEEMSELEVLMQAAGGPMDIFGSLGATTRRYVGVMGPPLSRRFFLGLWKTQQDMEGNDDALQEIDILKIQSVQPDTGRSDVFFIFYFDQHRICQKLTCRIVDRPVKLWHEMLTRIITTVKEHKEQKKEKKSKSSKDGR